MGLLAMPRTDIIFLVILSVFGVSASAQSETTSCPDIQKGDFRNSKIDIGETSYAFHDGEALNYDDPVEDNSPRRVPDWKATIAQDNFIELNGDMPVRVLLIHNNHETGSGWTYYVVVYRCSKGTLEQIFERHGLTLTIDKIDAKAIVVSVVSPTQGFPAARKHFSYIWDAQRTKLVLSSAWSTN